MAISVYFSAVNQKLLFARQLLRAVKSESEAAQHLQEAVAQSVALQLHMALRWHLGDIAATYQLKNADAVGDVDALIGALGQAGKAPAEAAEIRSLLADPNSWLSEIECAYAMLHELPEIRKAVMDVDRLPVINQSSESSPVAWTLQAAGSWLANMQELIERQREMMVEF